MDLLAFAMWTTDLVLPIRAHHKLLKFFSTLATIKFINGHKISGSSSGCTLREQAMNALYGIVS